MTPDTTTRPFSGEFMASPARRRLNAIGGVPDIVDAEFEEIFGVGRIVPERLCGATTVQTGLSSLSEENRVRIAVQRGGVAFWSGGALLALSAFWIAGGYAAFVQPVLAPVAALTLSGVSSRIDSSGVRPVILVDGNAGNDGTERAQLPGLEIRVADLAGGITRYRLGTSSRSLEPGERFAFSSRLDAPKNGVKSVSVTFAE